MWSYKIGIFFYYSFIQFAALFNHKAKLWVRGRKDIFSHMERTLKEKIRQGDKVLWFHCASLGEFEQGRPVIEKLKTQGNKIVLTFFSPSGYENRRNYEHADAVFYLPFDFAGNAERFVSIVKPTAALFVKYEFWLNYLAELDKRHIPTYLVSGVFRPKQHFFKWYGKSFFKALKSFKTLFVQDENSLALLKQHGFANAVLAGDTRFDRVMEIVRNKRQFPEIEKFCGNAQVIIAGSSWPKDEELLLKCFEQLKTQRPGLKLILVPHEIDKNSLDGTFGRLKNSGLDHAAYTAGDFFDRKVLVIDTIGMLSQIYQYATVAYVGGGFDNGIHNILEVMAHGVPVAFGPNYHKFVEAHEAEKEQLASPVRNLPELSAYFSEMLSNEEKRKEISIRIANYMRQKTGATEKVCRAINAS